MKIKKKEKYRSLKFRMTVIFSNQDELDKIEKAVKLLNDQNGSSIHWTHLKPARFVQNLAIEAADKIIDHKRK